MQPYELLFILPGTLTEDEVKPVAQSVTTTIEKAGGQNVVLHDLGKSRLAYPMKHIRYGYFSLCIFDAEPKDIPEIHHKIRLMPQLLRAMVHVHNPKQKTITKMSAISDVLVRENVGESLTVQPERSRPDAEVFAPVQVVKPVAAPAAVITETKAVDIKIEDIGKKLDEILDADIANV